MLDMCTSQSVGQSLAQNRAHICMLGLRSLQESWPVGEWVYKLFVYTMQRLQENLKSKSSRNASEGTALPQDTYIGSADPPGQSVHQRHVTHDHGTNGVHDTNVLVAPFQSADTDTLIALDDFLAGIEDQDHFFDNLDVPDWNLQNLL